MSFDHFDNIFEDICVEMSRSEIHCNESSFFILARLCTGTYVCMLVYVVVTMGLEISLNKWPLKCFGCSFVFS